MKKYLTIVTLFILLSACSEAYQAEKIIASIRNQLKTEQEALVSAQSAESYARGNLSDAYSELHTTRSNKEYDKVARSGAAGTAEQLRTVKIMLDNPNYSSAQISVESRANQRIEEATKALVYREEQVKKNAATVADTKLQLKQAEAVLATIRESH